MRKSKFTESQIVATLKQVEGGRHVKDICRDLEAEHNKLKRMYADMAMENHGLKELISKKL